jgi:hypothetical protein
VPGEQLPGRRDELGADLLARPIGGTAGPAGR